MSMDAIINLVEVLGGKFYELESAFACRGSAGSCIFGSSGVSKILRSLAGQAR